MKKLLNVLVTRSKECFNNHRGEINYFLAIAIGAVLLIVVAWPILKPLVSSIFTTVDTWFDTNLNKIFTNI